MRRVDRATAGPFERLRMIAGIILFFSLIGTAAELLLLEHTEDWWQLVPVVLIGAGAVLIVWDWIASSRFSVRTFRGAMLLLVASGFAGLYWHYQANLEFELEMYPDLSGFELFWKSIHGALPALAPAAMCQMGLLGLAYTFRHPTLSNNDEGRK